jgi:hypothetical protein
MPGSILETSETIVFRLDGILEYLKRVVKINFKFSDFSYSLK